LYNRIQGDIARLKQAMAEKGHFDGDINYTLVEDKSPMEVTLTLTLGKRYKISGMTVMAKDKEKLTSELTPSKAVKAIQVHIDDDVDLVQIQEANQRLAKFFKNHGYPYAEMAEPEGQIDRKNKRLYVTFQAIPGTYGTFGKSEITSLEDLDPQFVR